MNLPWRPVSIAGGPAIPTSLTAAEAHELRRLAEGAIVLEIGCAYGYSTIVMAQVARLVVTIDHHRHLPNGLAQFTANLSAYDVQNVIAIHADASLALCIPRRCYFNLAFIDGDHSRAGVLRDADAAEELLEPRGVLAFHDYGEDSCPEIRPALDERYGHMGFTLVDTLFTGRKG